MTQVSRGTLHLTRAVKPIRCGSDISTQHRHNAACIARAAYIATMHLRATRREYAVLADRIVPVMYR